MCWAHIFCTKNVRSGNFPLTLPAEFLDKRHQANMELKGKRSHDRASGSLRIEENRERCQPAPQHLGVVEEMWHSGEPQKQTWHQFEHFFFFLVRISLYPTLSYCPISWSESE